jgi:hypothetical protein
MGWVVFWIAVVVLLVVAWFVSDRRRGNGRADGATPDAVREGERGRGLSGWGMGPPAAG